MAWVGAWLAVVAIALWALNLTLVWIGVAAVGTVAWVLAGEGRRSGLGIAAGLALLLATLLALHFQLRLRDVAVAWPSIHAQIEENGAEAIGAALDGVVDRGERAVEGIARIAADFPAAGAVAAEFNRLEALRRQTAMSALAIYGPAGHPIAWAGEHRGLIPEAVRRGEVAYAFVRGPLFGYLYFADPIPGGRTAVAALLLDSSIPAGLTREPFAERFAARRGIEPRFVPPDRAEGDAVWDWTADRPILSVTFAHVTQDAWHARVSTQGRRAVGAVWALAALLLAIGWYRHGVGRPGIPVAVITVALAILPLGTMLDASGLFSPLQFVLAGPGDVTLGQLLVVLLGFSLWLLVRTPGGDSRGRFPLLVRGALAALVLPVALELIRRSASFGLLAAQPAGGLALVFATTLLAALPLYLLLAPPSRGRAREGAALPLIGGTILAAALGLALTVAWTPERTLPIWLAAAWGVPFLLVCEGLARTSYRFRTLATWLLAGWLAGTAATSLLWVQHMDARIDAAETELAHLGTEADPYLDYLLRQFAEQAVFSAAEGETGVNLLYRSWVASGLAREGYEARLTSWTGDLVDAELRFSDLELPPAFVDSMLVRAREAESPVLERYTEREGVHYLLLVPLADGRAVSVATPPRRRLGRATALARFLHADRGPEAAGPGEEALTLVPVTLAGMGSPAWDAPPGVISWVPTTRGWRSETTVVFPAGPAHAHLHVFAPATWILLVRGLLTQFLLLASFTLAWALARTLCGEPLGLATVQWQWVRTFRGRLTVALFGFFLLPTLALGAVTYGVLSQQVVRTGAAVAIRSLELAAPDVPVLPMRELGARVRTDLLLYREGGLAGASAPELIDLGLFQAWLPPSVALALATGEETEALEERTLAGNRYLVAYRRLGDDGVLAAPIPLAGGEVDRVQREFTHAFLLMMILGGTLSVVLALLVGRALARPIDLLSRATAAVGGGNLRLRLPEDRPDEFGGVYRAFNRMVRRLRRARADEVRTARVLAWGEMARQVAHEIKNPLTPIKLSVQHVRRAFSDGRPDFERILDRNVEAILREIDRLSQISRAFARFGTPRESAGDLEVVRVDAVVDETLVLYRGGKDGVTYRTRIAPEVPPVLARDGELREVLLNLLENAREAVEADGSIEVAAAPAGGGEWVQIDVADDGVGIPPDLLPHIFEPQFSTRTSGTGLGLAIVRRLVESWGGQISATSTPGEGTTFHLRLRAERNGGTETG